MCLHEWAPFPSPSLRPLTHSSPATLPLLFLEKPCKALALRAPASWNTLAPSICTSCPFPFFGSLLKCYLLTPSLTTLYKLYPHNGLVYSFTIFYSSSKHLLPRTCCEWFAYLLKAWLLCLKTRSWSPYFTDASLVCWSGSTQQYLLNESIKIKVPYPHHHYTLTGETGNKYIWKQSLRMGLGLDDVTGSSQVVGRRHFRQDMSLRRWHLNQDLNDSKRPALKQNHCFFTLWISKPRLRGTMCLFAFIE